MATTSNTDADDEREAASRHVAAVFEKFDRDPHECQELLCQASSHWLLSGDDASVSRAAATGGGDVTSCAPPPGLITNVTSLPQSRIILLVPADDTGFVDGLDVREVCIASYPAHPITFRPTCTQQIDFFQFCD